MQNAQQQSNRKQLIDVFDLNDLETFKKSGKFLKEGNNLVLNHSLIAINKSNLIESNDLMIQYNKRLNCYQLFVKEQGRNIKQKLKEENVDPKLVQQRFGKELAQMWKEMDEEQKSKYKKLENELKEKRKELNQFQAQQQKGYKSTEKKKMRDKKKQENLKKYKSKKSLFSIFCEYNKKTIKDKVEKEKISIWKAGSLL